MKRFLQTAAVLWCAIVPSLPLPALGQPLVQLTPPPSTEHQLSLRPDALSLHPLVLSSAETYPNAKALASEIALVLTTYERDEGPAEILNRLPHVTPVLSGAVAALHHPGAWSRGRIIYPQLGGLLPDRASVMVIVEQQISSPEGVRVETRTFDVRLRIVDGAWRLEDLASYGGEPVPQPTNLSPEALAVLGHPAISMPDSARWDIHAGTVSSTLLGLIARLADQVPIGIATLVSGHPWEIFGTDRQSDHTRGVAVDIYAVGTNPIIEDRSPGSTTYAAAQWLSVQPEVARLGSPWRFDNATAITFTDALHQDHLHIAVPRDAP